MKTIKVPLLTVGSVAWALAAFALEPIPETSGFGGFFSLGGGAISVENNMMAGNRLVDIGDENIDTLEGPDSETKFVPALNFELKCTFADTRTQLFLGNPLEDILTFDLTTQAGVMQEMQKFRNIGGKFCF